MGLSDLFKRILDISDDGSNADEKPGEMSFLPGEYENSIYFRIVQNIVDGKLSKEYSLHQDQIDGHGHRVPGAWDGIRFYHMNPKALEEDDKRELGEILHDLYPDTYRPARDRITVMLMKYPMISWADELLEYLWNNDDLSLENLFTFSAFVMYSTNNPETLKFALCLLEFFNNDDDYENVKHSVRELALCEEFTLFCLFNMRYWTDAEGEMLEVAKKVDGWGRVHAIRMMPAEHPATQRWLLFNGCDCTVNKSYTAYDCYEKAGLGRMDFAALNIDELKAVAGIIYALIDEGPVEGISRIDESYKILEDFAGACNNKLFELEVCEALNAIYLYAKNEYPRRHQGIIDNCAFKLIHPACRAAVEKAVAEGYHSTLEQAMNIGATDGYLDLLRQNVDKYNRFATNLMQDPEAVDEVIDIFDKNYTPREFIEDGEPYYYSDEMRIAPCINGLRAYPGKGVNLLIKASRSFDPAVRNIALDVARTWVQNTGLAILEIAPELQQAFGDMSDMFVETEYEETTYSEDYEDNRYNSEAGFSSKCKAILVGYKAREALDNIGQKAVRVVNYHKEPEIAVRQADFSLFFLAIYVLKNKMLGYGYGLQAEFTKCEWDKLLDLVEKLAAFDSYKELHDYLADYGKKYGNNIYEPFMLLVKNAIQDRSLEAKEMADVLREWGEYVFDPDFKVNVMDWF